MKYAEYRRKRRANDKAYAQAQTAAIAAVRNNDWRGAVRAARLCDAAYLEGVALDAVEIDYEGPPRPRHPAGGRGSGTK